MRGIVAGNINIKIAKALENCGFELLYTVENKNVLPSLSYHADMQIAKIGNTAICEPMVYDAYKGFIESSNITAVCGKTQLKCNYPNDIAYNIAVVKNFVFHNTKYTDEKILKFAYDKKFVNVAQGYSGCNTCQINDGALITSDTSIYKAAIQNDIDSLLISTGNIGLDGFDYGFIGGASFFYKETVYFFGSIKKHPDYLQIKSFCTKHNTEICELSDDILLDYGSLITLD